MSKIKIHEIAKKMELTSKEVLEIAKDLKIDVKSHMSSVEEEIANKIEEKIRKGNKKQAEPKQDKEVKEKKKTAEKKEKSVKNDKKVNDTPVIIRREVIISDEELEKEQRRQEQEKIQKREKQVGFIERDRKKDYNIVYRNKPTKPLTVSELFGLKSNKKEDAKQEIDKQEVQKTKIENKEEKNIIVETKTKVEVIKQEDKDTSFQRQNRNYNRDNDRNGYRNRDNHYNRSGQNWNRNGYEGKNNFRQNRNENGFNNYNHSRRPLDEKGIEKNIKNIMSSEVQEKEVTREYNKSIDKQKNNNRFEERNKKSSRNRRNNVNYEFNEDKLKSLKQENRLSNMFHDQEGGMLDYYDLTTQRGRKNKRKVNKNDETRTKQKIFKLTEITIPETITVKDFAAELKKTSGEVIKKLLVLN